MSSDTALLFFRPLSHYPFASAPNEMERYMYWVSGWFEKALLCAAVAWCVLLNNLFLGERYLI